KNVADPRDGERARELLAYLVSQDHSNATEPPSVQISDERPRLARRAWKRRLRRQHRERRPIRSKERWNRPIASTESHGCGSSWQGSGWRYSSKTPAVFPFRRRTIRSRMSLRAVLESR